MDYNTIILLAVIGLLCFSWFAVIVILSGTYLYSSITDSMLSRIGDKEIKCIVKRNPDSIQCVSMDEDGKMINITEGKILKMSYTDEPKFKGSKDIIRYYYIILPYYFSVDYSIAIGNGTLKIKTLDDLLKSFDAAHEESYRLINLNVPDKCLAVKVDLRESTPPYNTNCIFFDGGLSAIDTISNIFLKAILKSMYLPRNVVEEYYNLLESKIKNDSSITLFEYCMYIATFKYINEKKYDYISLCESERSIEC